MVMTFASEELLIRKIQLPLLIQLGRDVPPMGIVKYPKRQSSEGITRHASGLSKGPNFQPESARAESLSFARMAKVMALASRQSAQQW
jgi:hypothetical protein